MSFSNSSFERSAEIGGLCHLVEAATALSKLVEVPSVRSTTTAISKQSFSFSESPVTVVQRSLVSDDDTPSSSNKVDNGLTALQLRNKREIFPQRMLAILNDPSLTDVVTWLPNGRSFVIVRPDVFTESVLPKYLPPVDARGSTKYPSFTRKLNRWGFRQITRGPDTGAFHHPLFRRDEPELCLQMVCQRSRDRRGTSNGSVVSNKTKTTPAPAPTRSLPPKKRVFDQNLPALEVAPQQTAPATLTLPSSSATTVSMDDNSTSASIASSTSSTRTSPAPPESSVCAALPKVSAPASLPFVSKDESVVRNALKRSAENERLRVAKAMLYNAYLQALQGR